LKIALIFYASSAKDFKYSADIAHNSSWVFFILSGAGMETIKMPRPMRWMWASLGAYWLAGIIHPGFFSVAIMALLMIPIIIADVMFPPQPELTKLNHADETLTESETETMEVKENPV
jgi:hypothetical protein